MKRKTIAVVWIAGTTLPLLIAGAFLIGCCVLPLHGLMHKIMPLCQMAASMARVDQSDHGQDTASVPARPKDEQVNRFSTSLPHGVRMAFAAVAVSAIGPASETSFRSFITLGASRCDQDVGLQIFQQTFRI